MSDRKLLEEILRIQEPDPAFAYPDTPHDVQVTFSDVNDAACTLLGMSREKLLQLAPTEVIMDAPWCEGHCQPLATRCPDRCEGTLKAADGTLLPVEIRARILAVDNAPHILVFARDITDRQRNRHQAALDRKRFETLYRLTQMIDEPEKAILDFALEQSVLLTDSTIGYIYFMNTEETVLTLHAWSKDVHENCRVVEYKTEYLVSETGLWGEAVRQRKPIITNDYQNSPYKRGTPEGHVHIQRHMNLPVIDNGRIVIIAGLGNKRDEYTEDDVVQLSLIMEGVWRIIQRKRMESELRQAMREAENANKAKSQFLANMSHELRTPLNGIMGMTQILLGTKVTDQQKEYLNLSLEASAHLSRVMTSLLDLSSLESGGIRLAPSNFHLETTLQSVVTPLVLQAKEKGLSLDYTIEPNVPDRVHGDADKLRQILINLIFNAIKFTESGGVSLTVSRTASSSGLLGDMAELQFAVIDTGIGIAEDLQDSVFERFVLGEDYLTKRYGGSGLGLSISRELTEIMGGTISLSSTPKKGSTFILTLPFLIRESIGNTCPIPTPAQGTEPRSLNILVAEDEQVNALVTTSMLKKHGHRYTVVANGQHAIDTLMQCKFDMVLMDVQMPVINGMDVTKIIRRGAAEGVPRDLPIIGLTAYASDDARQRFLDAGMNCVVSKPFEISELIDAITSVMK